MAADEVMRVLIVEDEADVAMLIGELLQRVFSAALITTGGIASARDELASGVFDVVILDYRLPDGNGLDLLEEVNRASDPPAVVIVTGKGDEQTAASAIKLGVSGYVLKDENLASSLPDAVEKAFSIVAKERAESALKESVKRLEDVTENVLAFIWEVDAGGRYTYLSPSVESLLGYTPEELLGKHFVDPFHPEDREELSKAFLRAFSLNEPFCGLESRCVRRNGEVVWLSTNGVPVLDRDGFLLGYRGADTNITKQKEAEEALRKNQEDLRYLIDIAAHELRHPATVFKGYAHILMEQWDQLDEAIIRDALKSIDEAANRLVHLVVQLLDTSRIERGDVSLFYSDVNPRGLVTRAVEETRARGCENELLVRFPQDDVLVRADPERIKNVIAILLDNAVSYSPEGTPVEVCYRYSGEDIVFEIADRGPGIPVAHRDRIFERFYQLEDALHHSTPGIGLGLYIARTIANSHGGWIRMDPRDGGGSIFSFGIPCA